MAKYSITYNIIIPHEIEIDAYDREDAICKCSAAYVHPKVILEDFAETFPRDLSCADVEISHIFDKDGNVVY